MPRGHRPKLADVAAVAGVSTATASLVLRERPGPGAETRALVLAAAEQLGYRADRSASLLARQRTGLLGVTMDVRNTFHGELLEGLQSEADGAGYELVISPLTQSHGERRAVEALLDFRCEGLLLLGATLSAPDLGALAQSSAVVAIGRSVSAPDVDVVRAADDEGMGLAVAHLAALGHRRIAYVDGPRTPIATGRRRGFTAAARRSGLSSAPVLPSAGTESDGAVVVQRLLDSTPEEDLPTAFLAFNDRVALGALDALRRHGLSVPGDVSVVGYDDSPLARLATVALTSVSQDPETMARRSIETVVDRLAGRDETVEVVLTPRLVVRETTAGPVVRS